jgi:N6-L-threonylcarbamoyladenine synthase
VFFNLQKIIIGLDTSCYTTSIAAINLKGDIILDERIMLDVQKSKKGLRQSQAVFMHLMNIEKLIDKIDSNKYEIVAICGSKSPRDIKDSYMPVFNVSKIFAKSIALFRDVKLYHCSHQQNHIRAGLYNNKELKEPYMAIQISGGTLEILRVDKDISISGKTLDISYGQLIDRLGVLMGFDFPSGKYLDNLAYDYFLDSNNKNRVLRNKEKISIKDVDINLSGIETKLKKEYDECKDKEYISAKVMNYIKESLSKLIEKSYEKEKLNDFLIVGGVSSSKFLRNEIKLDSNINLYFAKQEFSSDNALGCALIGLDKYLG